MAQLIADRRDIDFVLYEQLAADALCRTDRYREFNRKTFDMILTEARSFALKEILPTFVPGDREGLRFEHNLVFTPACFHRAYRLFCENEYTALPAEPELGGQGLPHVISQAVSEYLLGANYAFTLYAWSGYGAGEMIEIFGTEEQKKMFLKKMYTGQWGGTMVLTEPEAGSDVGHLQTSARPNPDGTYSISGNKIFITNAEHDLTENIIHPVLARIEGAPAGTKGISLFIVPKIWVNPDGSLGQANDVVCTAIEEKMGIHASPTCQLTFGGKGGCRGLLLGEVNQGMRVMFHMMNAARILVGAIGATSASAAYLYALDYARQRRQGRDLEKALDPDSPQVPIIRHPDVRRMLMWMKTHVEGMRSLIAYGAWCIDQQKCNPDQGQRDFYKGMLDLLTPVIKAYCTDRGVDVCNLAIQVYGGYGYTKDYPVEQLLRDVRIAAIYEGTNGIQAMDLLGRKLGMAGGRIFLNLMGEMKKTVARARESAVLGGLAERLEAAVDRLGETAMRIGTMAMSERLRAAFAHACPFMDATGDCAMAWMLLWRAAVAAPALDKLLAGATGEKRAAILEKNRQAAFYEGQIRSAEFFIETVLPVTLGRMDSIQAGNAAAVEIPETAFGAY
jgi:alkylation response protein AidB-like acyl-CoA dehydrogenase